MSVRKKTISIDTDGTGAYSTTFYATGILYAVALDLGDLSTPDLDITDTWGDNTVLLSVNGVAADTIWHLGTKVQDSTGGDADNDGGDLYTAPAVFERLLIEVTGGGASKHGSLVLMMQR